MFIQTVAKWLHDNIGAALAYIAPIIAPLPSAIAVWSATGSIWTAIALETLGFAIVYVGLRTYSRNLRHKTDRRSLVIPVIGFLVYVAAVMWTVVSSEVLPAWAVWHTEPSAQSFQAFARSFQVVFLPMLTIVGALAYGWSAMLDSEASEEAAKREERRSQRLKKNAQRATKPSHATDASSGAPASDADILSQLETAVRQNPFASLRQIEEETGIGKDTANRRLKAAGYHKNGSGWEMIEDLN